MYKNVNVAIEKLRKAMYEAGIDPRKGLGDDLFLFSSSLIPIVNVDLFITNDKHQLLLIWRDDKYCGKGWHIPGGCVRLKETLEERIQKTAKDEIGSVVVYNKKPMVVREDINHSHRDWLENPLERSHNISFLYDCHLPEGFIMEDTEKKRWFANMPDDMLEAHRKLYGDIINDYYGEETLV